MLRAGCIERVDIGSKFIIIAQINQTERRNKKVSVYSLRLIEFGLPRCRFPLKTIKAKQKCMYMNTKFNFR